MKVKIKKLNQDAIIPKYQTEGASGFDFHSLEYHFIDMGQTKLIKTGLSFEIPKGYEIQVRPRSGTSAKTKMRIANAPGTLDSDFRGEVCIIIENIQTKPIGKHLGGEVINIGDRIAQGVLVPIIQAEFEEVKDLSESERNNGGFGSTGK